jgi:glycosyltransferase involved in cell wall biosynthesis
MPFPRVERMATGPHRKQRNMRIGFLVSRYPEISETFISRKVEYLCNSGHTVIIFCAISHAPGIQQDTQRLEIEDILLKGRGTYFRALAAFFEAALRSPVLFLRNLRTLLQLLFVPSIHYSRLEQTYRFLVFLRHKLDVLHVHFASNLSDIRGYHEALRTPTVVSLLGYDVLDASDAASLSALRLVPEYADYVLSSSEYLAEEFRQRCEYAGRIEILRPEVSLHSVAGDRDYSRGDPCRILSVCRLHWKKGLQYALDAVYELKKRNLHFLYDIVGDGDERPALQALAQDLGLSENVRFHGAIDSAGVSEFYEKADVFVLSSVRESFGVVLVEAQAAGLPVVATRVGGIPEAVQEDETALLVPPRDPTALADALSKLLRHPELRARLGRNGRNYACQFDIALAGPRLIDIYGALQNGSIAHESVPQSL